MLDLDRKERRVRDLRDCNAIKGDRRRFAVFFRWLWFIQEPTARGTPTVVLLVTTCVNPLLQAILFTGVKSDPTAGPKDYEKCKFQFTPGIRLGFSGLGKDHTRLFKASVTIAPQIFRASLKHTGFLTKFHDFCRLDSSEDTG